MYQGLTLPEKKQTELLITAKDYPNRPSKSNNPFSSDEESNIQRNSLIPEYIS